MALTIKSSAFLHNGEIPPRYTCDGEDISPPLEWSGVPDRTISFVLIVDNPDAPDPAAPKRIWVHWVLYNIPAGVTRLPEGVGPKDLSKGTIKGLNDWKKIGYGVPCPPIGRHRYFFKLYALDKELPSRGAVTKGSLEKEMKEHILAKAELIGTYKRL
jgi:hypothetical protein